MRIGIDFGTTYTKIAIYRGNMQFDLFKFPGPGGKEYIPTVVGYNQKGEIFIGERAILEFTIDPQNIRLATRIKLFLPIREPQEQKRQGWTLDKSPDEVVKEYFSQLFYQHNYGLQVVWGNIESAVVSVPEIWQRTTYNPGAESLRRILIDELKLPVDHLRSEPVCAAAYYAWAYQRYEKRNQRTERPFNLLLCDMGGGTFDVALCQVTGNRIEVLDFDGNSEGGWGLAGARFNEELLRKVFKRVKGRDPEPHELLSLIPKFEEIKRERAEDIENQFDEIIGMGILNNSDLLRKLGDTEFNSYRLAQDFAPNLREILESFEPIEEGIKQVLDRILKRNRTQIDRIAIVGGFGRFPLVRKTILKALGIQENSRNIEFDPILHRMFGFHYAIAYGAALIAAGEIEAVEYYPHSLLIKCWEIDENNTLKEVNKIIIEAGKLQSGQQRPTFAETTFSIQRQVQSPIPLLIQLNGSGNPIPIQLPPVNYPEPGNYKIGARIDRSNLLILIFQNLNTGKLYEYRLGNLDPVIFAKK